MEESCESYKIAYELFHRGSVKSIWLKIALGYEKMIYVANLQEIPKLSVSKRIAVVHFSDFFLLTPLKGLDT